MRSVRAVYEVVRGTVRRWLGAPSPTYEMQRGWNKARRAHERKNKRGVA